jgi:Xaa-Pro aminopeptidase
MAEKSVDAFLVFAPETRRYLVGFTGSNGQLWVTEDMPILLTDGRYAEQAAQQAGSIAKIVIYEKLETALKPLVARARRTAFESAAVNVRDWAKLSAAANCTEWIDGSDWIDELRAVKDDEEIAAIRAAVSIAESAYTKVTQTSLLGRSETDVALELEWNIRQSGSTKVPFDFIIASGKRSALPHGVAMRRTIHAGDPLTMDFGAEHSGYFSDMTFAGSVGREDPWLQSICNVLADAQAAAKAALRAGIPARDVDAAARAVITGAGWGDAFRHSLGHGVGMAVHEPPRLSPQSETVLKAGMVVTIEPGIYVPGRGGARLEDMMLVTESGAEPLTTIPKAYTVWD